MNIDRYGSSWPPVCMVIDADLLFDEGMYVAPETHAGTPDFN